jgi:hypothetical protein
VTVQQHLLLRRSELQLARLLREEFLEQLGALQPVAHPGHDAELIPQ